MDNRVLLECIMEQSGGSFAVFSVSMKCYEKAGMKDTTSGLEN